MAEMQEHVLQMCQRPAVRIQQVRTVGESNFLSAANGVMPDHIPAVTCAPHVEFEAVTALGKRIVECKQRVLLKAAATAASMSQQKRTLHGFGSVQVEIANRLACVGRFLGSLEGFLKFLLQQVAGVLLRLD